VRTFHVIFQCPPTRAWFYRQKRKTDARHMFPCPGDQLLPLITYRFGRFASGDIILPNVYHDMAGIIWQNKSFLEVQDDAGLRPTKPPVNDVLAQEIVVDIFPYRKRRAPQKKDTSCFRRSGGIQPVKMCN